MVRHFISGGVLAAAAVGMLQSPALAGGLERGGYNIDLLFDTSRFTAEATSTFVMPDRKLKNVTDTDPTPFNPVGTPPTGGGGNLNGLPGSANGSENYWSPRIGVKAGIGDAADCMFDYSEPWGAHKNPGANWAGANEDIETKVESRNYALTCSYRFDVGPGQLRLIGGGFYQEVYGFQERLVQGAPYTAPGTTGVGRLDLEGDGWGWRAGLAYEIPEYAFRASLVYNSEVKLKDITGTLDLSQVIGAAPFDVYGSQAMPDVLELKVQSGIAPDWLAFGSVKWTDWSQLQKVPFFCSPTAFALCAAPGAITTLDLGYRDGWTVMGGIGHKFNEQWSGAVSLTWDRGTSQGFGSQTDTWALGVLGSYSPTKNVEFRLAGVLGLMTGGSSRTVTLDGVTYGQRANYDFDDDIVAAISTSVKFRF
ncbi:transporter [Rhizobium wenxiniae]|uniref:OmpP1/FadL family transporter n=1 Tax=Rhizobium wenxiniae TaxID=1737357 RepID=UPI001C6F5051|nr:OmpP1/FadL family transporter [Rhizobium wenxiniae]MBW9090005.1 transporter [Rhizobium wenxiniae]